MRFVLLCLLLVIAGCDSAPAIDVTNRTTEGPLLLSVREYAARSAAPSGPPVLGLELQTEKEYECDNYRLGVAVDATGETLDLVIQGVEPISICLTNPGPARAGFPLDGPEGTYQLRVRHDGVLDEYRLLIAPDRVRVETVRAAATRVDEMLVWRRPVRSFVYVCSTFTGDEALCDRFRAEIESLATVAEIEVPDDGLWPYPRSSGGYYNDFPARVYRYETEADFLAVKDRLRAFSLEVLRSHGGDNLQVQNWKGETGYSTVYENE